MENPYGNNDMRKGTRVQVGVGINSLMHSLDESDESSKKALRAAKVQNLFKDCAKHLYGSSAFLVLQNINAVYILNERDKGMLKKAQPGDKLIKRLVIYTSDSTVYADLDSRQEMIKVWFSNNGERLDKLEIYSSKFQMRKRFPYKNDVELMKKNVISNKESEKKLVPPTNPEELMPLIEKIENAKLKNSLIELIKK